MKGNHDPPPSPEKLRQQALEMLQPQLDPDTPLPDDVLDLIHELRVHQIELELQNEELKRSQLELSELRNRYERLYEFAPCGYVTLSPKGIIVSANLTAVQLLGKVRERILNYGFSQFIDPGYADAFFETLRISGQTGQQHHVDLLLEATETGPLWIRADIWPDGADTGYVLQWSVTLFDISEKKEADGEFLKVHDELTWRFGEIKENLSKTNDALKTLLDMRAIEKNAIEQAMINNLKRYVFPYLEELESFKFGTTVNNLADIMRRNIEDLIVPMSQNLSGIYARLTKTEIKVADLVRQGATSKSIADSLYLSISTIEKHRNNIRRKIGILNKKVNLHAYLKSLSK